jgi:hypothetical protein
MSRSCTSLRTIRPSTMWIALIWIAIQIAAPSRGLASAPPAKGAAVRGVVWNSDNSPVPNAKVRLRNTQSGRIESNSTTSEDGRFAFSAEGGSYVVELVGDNGKVIAVGQSFHAQAGETVATFVRLSPRRPWFADIFSNASTAVIAAASSLGVTALGPNGTGPSVTPNGTSGRPISAQ